MEHTTEDIIYNKADRVARITINRPDAGNMFRAKTLHELKDALEDSRFVILRLPRIDPFSGRWGP